jgi:hypothetical protein
LIPNIIPVKKLLFKKGFLNTENSDFLIVGKKKEYEGSLNCQKKL